MELLHEDDVKLTPIKDLLSAVHEDSRSRLFVDDSNAMKNESIEDVVSDILDSNALKDESDAEVASEILPTDNECRTDDSDEDLGLFFPVSRPKLSVPFTSRSLDRSLYSSRKDGSPKTEVYPITPIQCKQKNCIKEEIQYECIDLTKEDSFGK